MPQRPRRTPIDVTFAKARPTQDMHTAKQQAGQFPSVGMTLRSYQYDPRDRHKRPPRTVVVKGGRFRRFFRDMTLKKATIIVAVLVLLIGGWLGGKFIYNAHKLFGGSILDVLHTTKLKGEDNGRVTILLAGNSADDAGHDGANLTDSIMILSIDTKNNKAYMLSVPRDLWVKIPDAGHQKINAAYVEGQADEFSADGFPKGGMGELEQIVEQDFGVDINYYALVNYNALRQAVNAVGGIDYTVHSKDPRGLYDPSIDYVTHGPLVKLSNGTHHLNGQQALNLARARGDNYNSYGFPASDFDRTEHQREMMVALKNKAVSAGVLANPAKLSSLSDAIGNNVKTDLNLSEVRRLYDIVKPISGGNIQSLSLNNAGGKNLLASYAAPGGQSALIPAAGLDDYHDIRAFIRKQTSSNPIVQESAKVVVLNSTQSNGLATKKRTTLEMKNIDVTAVGDARTPRATTLIIDNSKAKMPGTRQLLMQLFGNGFSTTNPYSDVYDADFIVILGNDQIPRATQSQQ